MNTKAWTLALGALLALGVGASAKNDGDNEPLTLKAGYRGVYVPFDAKYLSDLKPGDHVDVLVTFPAVMAKGEKENVTATILQNVLVLKVNKGDGVIQLMLNPNESQYAIHAVETSQNISFILRAPGDTEMNPMEMASFRKLFR